MRPEAASKEAVEAVAVEGALWKQLPDCEDDDDDGGGGGGGGGDDVDGGQYCCLRDRIQFNGMISLA